MQQGVLLAQETTRLTLGPYEAQLRQFLLDGPFPEDAALVVSLTNDMARLRNMLMVFPFFKNRSVGFRQYRFTVPGITFQLFLGKRMPAELQRLAIHSPEQNVLMSSDIDDVNMGDAAKLISRTRKRGALAR